jgi:glycerol-3-phosphate cytidylyltransferase
MLADARSQCDILVVGLHADPSVERPDKNKPVLTVEERKAILEAVRYVDEVRVYATEKELADILWALRPDVRVLGTDWQGKEEQVTALGASRWVHWHKRNHDWSSSAIRRRVFEAEYLRMDREMGINLERLAQWWKEQDV